MKKKKIKRAKTLMGNKIKMHHNIFLARGLFDFFPFQLESKLKVSKVTKMIVMNTLGANEAIKQELGLKTF